LATAYLQRWPIPDFDEGLYANPALNLIQKGNFGSSAMSGVLDMGHVTFWFLPLHSLLLWLPVKLLGFHIWAVRLFSVVCGLVTLLALYKLARSFGVASLAATLLVLFMGTDFMFLAIARRSRMEALLCFLHVGLLLLLVRAERSGRTWSYFVPGLLAGAGLLTHPLGSLAIPAFLLFSWPKPASPEWTHIIPRWLGRAGAFALGILIACFPYLIFVLVEGPGEFWQQLVVYQAHYCYDQQGFVGGPPANIARLVEMWRISHTWQFFLLKLLLLIWLAWPAKTVRRLFALVLIELALFSFAWPSGAYWEYWVPTLYSTLAVCAFAGKISPLAAESGQRIAGWRSMAGLVFSGMVVLNLAAVFRTLYRYHTNDVGQTISELRKISLEDPKGKTRLLGNTAFLFAFPKQDFRSCLVVRSSMDLRHMDWDRALLDVSPEILLVDDMVRSGQWPAFHLPPGHLRQFLSRYGTLRGTVRGGLGARDNLVEIYELDLAALTRESAARHALETPDGGSPAFLHAENSAQSAGVAQPDSDHEPTIAAQ
jgi:hypothetical protein